MKTEPLHFFNPKYKYVGGLYKLYEEDKCQRCDLKNGRNSVKSTKILTWTKDDKQGGNGVVQSDCYVTKQN